MARKSRSNAILDKAVQAALSAIELYNKPSFLYREESFSILMTNAWELLLKAKLISQNKNNLNVIYATEKNKNNAKKINYKKNRSGNKMTISIEAAIERLSLQKDLRSQLETLIEIRDNAIHFYNESKILDKKILEVGTATLKSFIEILGEWFDYPIGKHKLFLIPLAFDIPESFDATALTQESKGHQKLLKYIINQENNNEEDAKHRISLQVDVRFTRNKTGLAVHSTNDSENAIPIVYDEGFRNKYPWTYRENLIPELKKRYTQFTANKNFIKIKNSLEKHEKFSKERYLDENKKSSKKRFYSPNIMEEFDKHYDRERLASSKSQPSFHTAHNSAVAPPIPFFIPCEQNPKPT
ncbi:MAG: DUF3644 domain-containing protein [Holosporaceae bacterium]